MAAVYIFGAILLILLMAVVFAPMVERKSIREAESPTIAGRKTRALEALRELEFEYETGKMADSDYNRLRAHWANEAIEARDALGESKEPSATGECTVCGAAVRAVSKFCSRCGQPLAGAADGV